MRVLILPSPLLGPSTYAPLADALTALGHPTTVAPVSGRTVRSVLAGFAENASHADLVVPHSNAGRFAAAVAAVADARIVYLDALLPDSVPGPGFRAFLRDLADPDGVLPGWTEWWPAAEVDALLGGWRPAVEKEQGRWPLAFLTDPVPVPGWADRPSGYVAFGTAYDEEATRAADLGWPVRRLDGHHLHHLVDPGQVAETVLALAAPR